MPPLEDYEEEELAWQAAAAAAGSRAVATTTPGRASPPTSGAGCAGGAGGSSGDPSSSSSSRGDCATPRGSGTTTPRRSARHSVIRGQEFVRVLAHAPFADIERAADPPPPAPPPPPPAQTAPPAPGGNPRPHGGGGDGGGGPASAAPPISEEAGALLAAELGAERQRSSALEARLRDAEWRHTMEMEDARDKEAGATLCEEEAALAGERRQCASLKEELGEELEASTNLIVVELQMEIRINEERHRGDLAEARRALEAEAVACGALRRDIEAHEAVARDSLRFAKELHAQARRVPIALGEVASARKAEADAARRASEATRQARALRAELFSVQAALSADRGEVRGELQAAGAAEARLLHALSEMDGGPPSMLGSARGARESETRSTPPSSHRAQRRETRVGAGHTVGVLPLHRASCMDARIGAGHTVGAPSSHRSLFTSESFSEAPSSRRGPITHDGHTTVDGAETRLLRELQAIDSVSVAHGILGTEARIVNAGPRASVPRLHLPASKPDL